MNITQNRTRSAFTLVETITAMACGTIVLAALLAMSISLQRSFAAVEGYSVAEGDQLRLRLLEDALAFRDLAFAVPERSFARRNLLFTRHELSLERLLLLLEVRSERRGSGLGARELLLPL